MNQLPSYSLFPLGDSALLIDFGNVIDEDINNEVLRIFYQLRSVHSPYILDVVPAYSSLAVYYDVAALHGEGRSAFEMMIVEVSNILSSEQAIAERKPAFFEIPVCYSKKFGIDIQELSRRKHVTPEEIIKIHTSKIYRVYMLGFLPGFTYMGEVDERISIERKPVPINLFGGAVGIAGRQTGIYPFESLGGWQIIGRTPIKVFRKEEQHPVMFYPGDEIKFYSISEYEFANYQARRS